MKLRLVVGACLLLLLALLLWAVPIGSRSTVSREFRLAQPWPVDASLRLQRGDDSAWARPDFDDTTWRRIGLADLPSRDGIYWIRTRITIPDGDPETRPDALAVAIIASYEVYWDGRLLGRSGNVGADLASEVPGKLDQVFRLPDPLATPGDHVLAFRISSFRTGFPSPTYGIKLGLTSQRSYFSARAEAAVYSVVALGGTGLMALVILLVWLLVARRIDVLLFALLCTAATAVQALQLWRGLFYYTYDWHRFRILWLIACVAVLGVLLVAFVSTFLRTPHRGWWIGGVAVVHAGAWLADFSSAPLLLGVLCWSAVGAATLLAGWSWWRGDRRAAAVLTGLLVTCLSLARGPMDFLEHAFFYGFGATLLGGVTALVLQLRAERQAARQAELTAARLEIELLKKNIQPHFVLNTLTALTEVIEQEPKLAVSLIEALAAEFRLLARMAGRRLVPLREELELCREHLRVMSLRQDVRYALRVENVDEAALVPPAVFLTLLENALTHATQRGADVEFVLRREIDGDTERHVFFAPTHAASDDTAPPPAAGDEGTGSRYVKARLEESFAGGWKFASGPSRRGWETVIELRRSALRASPA